jgi:hypothetical protein
VHLRAPSVDKGVSAFVWSVVFFLAVFLGGLAIGVSGGIALVFGLVVGFLAFLLVRTRGSHSRDT